MSEFLARALKKQDGRQGPRCGVSVAIERMDPAYREQVMAAVDDSAIRSTVICEVLREDGIEIRPETLQRHRSGRCACPKT
jgi:hypothetical protein